MPSNTPIDLAEISPGDFMVTTFDDELRVDGLCARLLAAVRDHLVQRQGRTPLEAGELCRGADYFLRDFIIAECAGNLFSLPPERVRQFAGHWYIVRTPEPNIEELAIILAGIKACYGILAEYGLVDRDRETAIALACGDIDWYRQRIETFWAIEGDGYDRWRKDCPLPALHS